MRPRVTADTHAECGSRAHGSGLEEQLAASQDPVPFALPGIPPQRHGRPRAHRSRDLAGRVHDTRPSIQFVAARCAARLRSVPDARRGSRGRRLVSTAHLRRLPDAPGIEPERADAHRRQSDDGAAVAVRHQSSGRVCEQREVPYRPAGRGRLCPEPRRLRRERLLEGDVLQHLLQRARHAVRRPRLRLRWPRHAEQQRPVQSQHLRPADRNLDRAPSTLHPGAMGQGPIRRASCSKAIPTRPFIRNAIRETSRARNHPNRRTRSTAAGIRRRFRCRTTRCSSSAASIKTTPSLPIQTA